MSIKGLIVSFSSFLMPLLTYKMKAVDLDKWVSFVLIYTVSVSFFRTAPSIKIERLCEIVRFLIY